MKTRVQVHYYPNLKSFCRNQIVDLEPVLMRIKNGPAEDILRARASGKGTDLYKKIKEELTPALTPNFIFLGDSNNYSSISHSTGIIYIDRNI